MALPIFKEIERLITEHGSAAILKERNALLKDQLNLLKAEFAKLERRNTELERRLAVSEQKEQFVEENGALFKRRPEGGYHKAVYCPKCRQSTAPFPEGAEFVCSCGWFSSFTEGKLSTIMAALPN